MSDLHKIATNRTTVPVTDDAGGVSDGDCWFVARTHTNRERKCQALAEQAGYTTYLPQQEEMRQWSQGRKRKVQRLVIPGILFVHCSDQRRVQLFQLPSMSSYLAYWLTDSAQKDERTGRHGIATISEHEMSEFQQVVSQAETPVTLEELPLQIGDTIRIKRGALQGCTGELERLPDGQARLVIRLSNFGAAKVLVDLKDIELL